MAPAVGFWRFMDDVHDMTFPMACVDWRRTPDIDEVTPTINRVQKDATRPADVPSLGKEDLVEEETPAKVNTHQLIEDLNKQKKELLQERSNAIKWQDAASMAIREAKDEADTRKQETNAAKKAGFRAVAMVQRQLVDSRDQVAALKRDKARAGVEKNRAEAERRKEVSVAEGRIKESQTGLISAISHGRESIELFEELFRMSEDMQNELVAKDQQLAAKEREKKELRDRINARTSVFEDISEEARKDREACDKSQREKLKSEKAQRAAERRVNGLQREAVTVKATTDKAMKALQSKLAESVARETGASTRAIKAEGDAEKFRRELDNTESARQMFEKREGEWAALFAANQTHAGTSSHSTRNIAVAQESETNSQIATTTADRVEVSKLTKVSSKKKKIEEWKWDVRRELEEKNQTALATERENIRRELDEEKRIALVTERQAIRGIVKSSLKAKLVMRLKSQKKKELRKIRRRATAERVKGKKGQVKWDFVKAVSPPVEVDRSQLETQIRSQLQNEFQNELANQKTQWKNEKTAEQSQLETRIRSQLQTELQNDLASHRSRWETEHAAVERPRLETQIRTQLETEFQNHQTQWQIQYVDIERSQLENQIRGQLQDEYEDELSQFKTQWEVEHSPSQAAIEAHNNEVPENQIEVDESGGAGAVAARSAEDDMVLASLSRESDETHELFQEIGRIGIPRDSVAYTVLQGLNKAKDALYDIKCELRKPDAIANKNNLLHSVKGVHVNKHYIRKLSLNTREVLIRQANEANTRLEYVKNTLGTNVDVPKDVMLKSLLEPLQTKTEPEHMDVSAPPQMGNGFGDAAAVGTSTFPQTVNEARHPAAPGTSTFTTFDGNANPAAHGTSTFPVTVSSFGNVAIPSISETDHNSSSSSTKDPKALNSFGDTTAPGLNKTSTESVFNPFEGSHFGNQPSLDSTPCQIDQDSGRSDRKTETDRNSNSNFNETFRFLPPQGEGPEQPVNVNATAGPEPSFNFSNLSSTAPEVSSDKDHQMDTGDSQPPLTATRDHGGVASRGFVASRQRQAKNSQAQQRGSAPKGRQLAHKAFAKKQNNLASVPFQIQQVDPQDQVPATQQFRSFEFPRTAFTLDPNHAFDLTPDTSNMERGNHLRVQQDPAEYQKPLKIFQISEEASPASEQHDGVAMAREGSSTNQSWPPKLMPPRAEDLTPETPPGCEGWTNGMERHAQDFLKGTDIEQVQFELWSLYPSTEHMTGLARYLQKLKQDIEAAEPDQVQSERMPEQPAGWTNQMTEFVEGSLCGGNDVNTTVNLFRLEIAEAFDIQGLEEHVEKLRNEYVRGKEAQLQQDQVSQEPFGWNDGMTAIIQECLRKGDRDVDLMVQSLEVVDPDALFVDGVNEHVTKLMSNFDAQGQDQKKIGQVS